MNQFMETKVRFEAATRCEYPISYAKWMSLPIGLRAAALFVNFYDQITLAWQKAKAEYTSDEEGIGVVMQYLLKNTDIISNDPKKFTPNYIYRVAYNCMGCLRRVQRDQKLYELCTSQFAYVDGEEIDLFTRIVDNSGIQDIEDTGLNGVYSKEIYEIVQSLDDDVIKVLSHLVDGTPIGVRLGKRQDVIVEQLKGKFVKYRKHYLGDDTTYFSEVLDAESDVASAVVVMRDGVQAVYYGEKRVSHNGDTDVVFYGPTHDYFVPLEQAKALVVTDIELN